MRVILLEACMATAALVFVAMMCAIAWHRAKRRPSDEYRGEALSEYAWAVFPWILIAGSALPGVRLVLTGH
jgi:heme/copper-type cytochrome/quinol oxidase subunit 2